MRFDLERTAERLAAFAHAEQAQARPRDGRIEPFTVVGHHEPCAAACGALELDRYLARARVLAGVRQALLHDAVEADARVVTEVVVGAAHAEPAKGLRVPLVPAVDEVFERSREPELVEQHGPQPPQHAAHDGMHPRGDLRDRRRARAAGAAFDRSGYGVDGCDRLPELVVKLVRERAPFGFLDRDRLLRQMTILLAAPLEHLGHAIELAGDRRELRQLERR